eukprot:3664629-Pyramimonas_sp.AAC.1
MRRATPESVRPMDCSCQNRTAHQEVQRRTEGETRGAVEFASLQLHVRKHSDRRSKTGQRGCAASSCRPAAATR